MGEEQFTVKLLDEHIVEVTMRPHVYLDVSVTDQVDIALEQLAPGKKFYQLVIAHGPYAVNPEMRNAMAHQDTGVKQLAIAWVSPDEKANAEQEEIVSKVPIPIPIRFFTERETGLQWLKDLAAGNK